ncbi:MAG: hypothetical protein N2114_03385 [Candidatus Goldbacteria bacterium]|nr:hypothetical protein [Candidatus Goldiibacteriota bacterium]
MNLPQNYARYYDDLANKNILPHNADILEKKHNINICIFKYRGKVEKDIIKKAEIYFAKFKEKYKNRCLFIFITDKRDKSFILITDDLKNEINEKYLKILQDDVFHSLLGRWYISEARVLGKLLGGIIYLLKKDNLNKEQIDNLKSDMIIVDDFFYLLSRKPFFSDLTDLFEFEPVSFFFYFPFVLYFIFVRIIGIKFQKIGFIISNIIWLSFVLFVFYLILHRIDIFFHEYMQIFYLFISMNVPLYLYFTNLYRNEIEIVAYNYISNITGGFDTKNVFQDKV